MNAVTKLEDAMYTLAPQELPPAKTYIPQPLGGIETIERTFTDNEIREAEFAARYWELKQNWSLLTGLLGDEEEDQATQAYLIFCKIFADWCEENGQTDRAAAIRLAVADYEASVKA